jgi:ribosome biogenesis GTPase / thiamine phosphate phosphatase
MQILAANIDTVFIVTGLDGNFSTGRIERFLTATASSGASPVLLLNKADLCPDPAVYLEELERIAKGRPVHVVSAATGAGIECFAQYLTPGKTVAFLGSSGAGKSTLVNRLFGIDLQSTGEVNEATGKGRHTTSRAELFVHGSGCMLIDTPGIRELQLWCDGQAVEDTFEDVAALSGQCRFTDCQHGNEPGCAVRAALRSGELSESRFRSYTRLYSEVRHLEMRKKQRNIMISRQMKHK